MSYIIVNGSVLPQRLWEKIPLFLKKFTQFAIFNHVWKFEILCPILLMILGCFWHDNIIISWSSFNIFARFKTVVWRNSPQDHPLPPSPWSLVCTVKPQCCQSLRFYPNIRIFEHQFRFISVCKLGILGFFSLLLS